MAAAAITAGFAVMPPMAAAADAPAPDTGAVGSVSNGGEWSIYASKAGSTRIGRTGTAIQDASGNGVVEVNGSNEIGGQFQFDLSTMMTNDAASGKTVKSAKLRLTPVVSRSGVQHTLYVIDNAFTTIEGKVPAAQYTVPRGGNNDMNKDSSVTSLKADGLNEYPGALKTWQTDIDITGSAVTAENGTLSLDIEYASGGSTDNKTEYATTNADKNARLNGNAIPFLYNGGVTDYTKWVYPQIVFTYTDSEVYKSAYDDFISAYETLSTGKVTENSGITLGAAANGSTVTLGIYGDSSAPAKADGQQLVYNSDYVGDEESANVTLTVTKTVGEETAEYSRVVNVPVEYTKANTITFDVTKNPKGEPSVTSAGKTYTDGTAYAVPGGVFSVNGGANTGYEALVTVKKAGTEEEVAANADGTFTMPNGDAEVSIEYSKKTFGTTRIAAINSVSFKTDGSKQGYGSSPNIVIGAGRVTFVKFDLSGYNEGIISDAELKFDSWNTANTKAVFYVPNNDWDESGIEKSFMLDGTSATNISAFATPDGDTVSLLNGANVAGRIIPNGADEDDASNAAEGILKDYYAASTGTSKTSTISVTDAVRSALEDSEDGILTFMIYSAGGGNDAYSVQSAAELAQRPSLTITESAQYLPDSELVTEIASAEDLVRFAEIVNGGNEYKGKTVTLANDIDLSSVCSAESGISWTAIGCEDIGGKHPFGGVFEGGGHSVTGLYINNSGKSQGLFGVVSGTVRGLTVSGEITASSAVGGIAGWNYGRIENCRSNVVINALREAGGIAGTLANGGVIENCENTGDITVTNKETYAGGIAGQNIRGSVIGCTNSGKIENGMDGFRNKLGGIVGYLNSGTITGSNNSGSVVSNAEKASYTGDVTDNYVGGITGYSEGGTIKDSNNSGTVHNAVYYAGGIAGYLQYGDTVSNCNNSGPVSAGDYAGGIVGYNKSDISNCRNDGLVTSEGDFAGGVVGYLSLGTLSCCSFDEELNSGLDIVGHNDRGTITDEPTQDPGKVSVYAEDGIIIVATYAANGALEKIEFRGEVEADEIVQDIEVNSNQKAFVWTSLSEMKPVSTKEKAAE